MRTLRGEITIPVAEHDALARQRDAEKARADAAEAKLAETQAAMQLQIGDHARLNGELVEIVDFRRCPTVKDGGDVAYIPGVSVRWLSTGTVSYTQGAVYTAELRDLLPKEPGQP